jgi:hypothetical protein
VWLKANKPRTVQGAIDLAIQFQQATAVNCLKKPKRDAVQSELSLTNLLISQEVGLPMQVAAADNPQGPALSADSSVHQQLKTLADQVKALTEQLRLRPKGKREPPKCFGCDQPGHFKRNCPNTSQSKPLN